MLKLPAQDTGKWTFHLQLAQTLQFHIASEEGVSGHIIIDGHDISALLDYLYDNRELIYDATHDEETRLMEEGEARKGKAVERGGKRILYIDDGIQRSGTVLEA
jgi:hypothetical protein